MSAAVKNASSCKHAFPLSAPTCSIQNHSIYYTERPLQYITVSFSKRLVSTAPFAHNHSGPTTVHSVHSSKASAHAEAQWALGEPPAARPPAKAALHLLTQGDPYTFGSTLLFATGRFLWFRFLYRRRGSGGPKGAPRGLRHVPPCSFCLISLKDISF